MKQCTTCKELKPFKDFYKNKTRKDGLSATCKVCDKVRHTAWKRKNPERMKQYFRDYYKKHEDKFKNDSYRKYRREIRRRWCLNNPEKVKSYYITKGWNYRTALENGAYSSWHSMKQRCKNPKHSSYKWYGERGIQVCERWESYKNFLEDMGPRPPGTSIERIDNDGDYEPDNCKWATPKEQANNQRRYRKKYKRK